MAISPEMPFDTDMETTARKSDDVSITIGQMLTGLSLALAAIVLVLLVPAWHAASAREDATGPLLIAFSPATSDAAAMSAIHRAGGLPVKQMAFGNFWLVQVPREGFVRAIEHAGAWAVLQNLPNSIVLAGCTGTIPVTEP